MSLLLPPDLCQFFISYTLRDLAHLQWVINGAYPAQRRAAQKTVVRLDYRLRGDERINAVRTSTLVDYVDIQANIEAGILELLEGTL